MIFDLKDLKLSDMIKIALTVTAILAFTFNVALWSNNTTIINNYIQETNKKLDVQAQKLDNTQGNITKVQTDINKTLITTQKILKEVD